jgi:mercuric ion transport protein
MATKDVTAPLRGRPLAGERHRAARAGLAAAGGLVGALAASSCCILPLALFSVGAGGAWIGNLTALAPYQPFLLAVTAAMLGFGFHQVYRGRRACPDGEACARPLPDKLAQAGLWIATALVGAAMAFPAVAPLFLSV